jgi:hypothetical protein
MGALSTITLLLGKFRLCRYLLVTVSRVAASSERTERLIHSACAIAEQQFFADTFAQLSDTSRTRLDTLLTSSLEAEESDEKEAPDETREDVEGDEERMQMRPPH